MAGKLIPETVNPAPVITAELIVSGDDPEEVSVTVCGEEVLLMVRLPKFRLLALNVSPGTAAPRAMV